MDEKSMKKVMATWKWRIARVGLTQEEFCGDGDVCTSSNLSQYMGGKKVPRLLTLNKIESKLKGLEEALKNEK